MKRYLLPLYVFAILVLGIQNASATPTRFGDTGMMTQPSADTHQSGSICIGLWGDSSRYDGQETTTLVPATITLGLGTFLEAYGAYPNLAFNDDESESRLGFANVGMKARIWGKRSSPFKVAFDAQARRFISNDPSRDGLTDYLYRGITTLKLGKFSLHAQRWANQKGIAARRSGSVRRSYPLRGRARIHADPSLSLHGGIQQHQRAFCRNRE